MLGGYFKLFFIKSADSSTDYTYQLFNYGVNFFDCFYPSAVQPQGNLFPMIR